jgi:hypothetical protein
MEAGAALYLAAKKGDAQRVRALFVAGADLHAKPVRLPARRQQLLARSGRARGPQPRMRHTRFATRGWPAGGCGARTPCAVRDASLR